MLFFKLIYISPKYDELKKQCSLEYCSVSETLKAKKILEDLIS